MFPASPVEEPAAVLTETATRYLETIYYMEHEDEVPRPGRLAEWLGVSPPTVSVSLQRLARAGWVSLLPDRSIRLTTTGRSAAAAIVRRHRLVERWLTDVLELDWATADHEAASLAHGMSELVLERLNTLLGHPSTCPHGNAIPGQDPVPAGPLERLSTLALNTPALIKRISEVAEHEAPQLLATLHADGLMPGTGVTVTAREPAAHHLVARDRSVSVSDAVARSVWVEASSGAASDS